MSNSTDSTVAAGNIQPTPYLEESLPGRRIAELLAEFQRQIGTVLGGTRDRMSVLLRSVMAVSSGLDLDDTLRQITKAAIELVDARYGALGVLDEKGALSQFIFVEMHDEEGSSVPAGGIPGSSGTTASQQIDTSVEEAKRLLLEDLVDNPISAGFLADRDSTRRFLGTPVFARGEVFGRLYLAERHTGAGLTEDDETVIRALAGAAGIAVDNSRLYEKGRRHRRWLEATAEVTTELLGGGEAEEVLQLIAGHALDLTGADYALVALPDDQERPNADGAVLTVSVCVGMGSDEITGRTMPISGSTAGAVFADRIPRNVEELAFDLADGLGTEFGPALALPLGTGKSLAGILLVVRTPGSQSFDELEMQMVSLFAAQAMLALERSEVQAARRELASLAERDRIAQDLHDHVIQRLFAVGLSMESTQQLIKNELVGGRLADHVNQVYAVIAEIRSAIFDLQTGVADTSTMRTSLHQIITDLTADAPARITVAMSGELDALPPRLVMHIRAVVREGVSNAVRHANSDDIVVTVSVADDLVVVDIADNGVGITDTAANSGLHNVQERARAAGGKCTVRAQQKGGTRMVWSAPVVGQLRQLSSTG